MQRIASEKVKKLLKISKGNDRTEAVFVALLQVIRFALLRRNIYVRAQALILVWWDEYGRQGKSRFFVVRRYVLMLSVLFNVARPNFNSRSNNMGGAVSYIQDLRIYKSPCTDGDPLADKFFLSLFSPCVYCK